MNEEEIILEEFRPLSVGNTVPNIPFKVFHEGKIEEKEFTIESFRGKWVIFFFYPGDFTFICPTELAELASHYEEFQKEGAEIISFSTDTVFSHKVWYETSDSIKKIQFPMGSDHRHDLVQSFGVYCEEEGLAYRATYIIDPKGVIRCAEIHDNSIGRSSKELLRKLRAAKHVSQNPGHVCPASWDTGSDTLQPGDNLVGKI